MVTYTQGGRTKKGTRWFEFGAGVQVLEALKRNKMNIYIFTS